MSAQNEEAFDSTPERQTWTTEVRKMITARRTTFGDLVQYATF
jgi:hypothetical protein